LFVLKSRKYKQDKATQLLSLNFYPESSRNSKVVYLKDEIGNTSYAVVDMFIEDEDNINRIVKLLIV
jgi:hypothetical protein